MPLEAMDEMLGGLVGGDKITGGLIMAVIHADPNAFSVVTRMAFATECMANCLGKFNRFVIANALRDAADRIERDQE